MSDSPFNTVSAPAQAAQQFHTAHGSGLCNCIPATGGYVRHNPGCPLEPVESYALRQAHAIDTAQLRQRFAAVLAHHLDGDHMWDEYAFEGDGVEYMEAAHKAIHAEDTESESA